MSEEIRPDRFGAWDDARRARIPEYKKQIIEGIRRGLWISEISEQIQVGTRAISDWRQQDPEFGEQYREAESAVIDRLEQEAVRRAMYGVADVVIQGGKIVMDPRSDPENPQPLLKRTYSDGLMMFILKGRRREVYGDKIETDNTHKINVDGARETLAEKLRRAASAPVAPSPAPRTDELTSSSPEGVPPNESDETAE